MRWLFCLAVVLVSTGVGRAQEAKPEDLSKMYQETLEQLKDAQNRKTQLAAENADLQKKLAAANAELAQLRQDAAHYDQNTYLLRTQFSAWTRFMELNRPIKMAWDMYLHGADSLGPRFWFEPDDPDWPLSAGG